MKNNSIQVKTVFIIFSGIFCAMQISAQSSAAKAQPVSKTASVNNSANTSTSKLAPWETQKIQPAKKQVAAKTITQDPSAAQTIIGK